MWRTRQNSPRARNKRRPMPAVFRRNAAGLPFGPPTSAAIVMQFPAGRLSPADYPSTLNAPLPRAGRFSVRASTLASAWRRKISSRRRPKATFFAKSNGRSWSQRPRDEGRSIALWSPVLVELPAGRPHYRRVDRSQGNYRRSARQRLPRRTSRWEILLQELAVLDANRTRPGPRGIHPPPTADKPVGGSTLRVFHHPASYKSNKLAPTKFRG
jgi:hypothetical protein